MKDKSGNFLMPEKLNTVARLYDAIEWQASHCERNDAPMTARVIRTFHALARTDLRVGRRLRNWPCLARSHAMPLRLTGGLHSLALTGADRRLVPVYLGDIADPAQIEERVLSVVAAHDAYLLPWLDGPPQTNEAARSSSFAAALLWLADRITPCFELNELGASAGINTMMERYFYNLGGVRLGPSSSPMHIVPKWEGAAPPDMPVRIATSRGCDLSPINLCDSEALLRLKSYAWPDTPWRLERIDAAAALAAKRPPEVDKADAGDWVEGILASLQPENVARVFYHSIVWQYLPPQTQDRIEQAIVRAGNAATKAKPLVWIRLETNRETFQHELSVRYWPDGPHWQKLGHAHAHGAWVNWMP